MEYDRLFEYDDLDDWDDLDDSDDEYDVYQEEVITRVPRRYLRDRENPLEVMTDEQFKMSFRFRKETVANYLVPLLFPADGFNHCDNRGLPLPSLLKVLVALRFYATSSIQIVCGDLCRVSQPSVSKLVKEISEKLASRIPKFIKFPDSPEEIRKVQHNFFRKAGFPEVVGLVDGTHIPIKSPGGDQVEVFRNRKNFFSLNVQLVTGPDDEIFNIVCRWPGSAQDSKIFQKSTIRQHLAQNFERKGHLLGDSGYAQREYIFTPVKVPRTKGEIAYNRAHIRTWSQIERTVGKWKMRFPCLVYELQNSLHNTLRIIPACAVLHNIGLQENDLWEEEKELDQIVEVPVPDAPFDEVANKIRQQFINRHFQ